MSNGKQNPRSLHPIVRLIMKIPCPNLSSLPPAVEGFFWAVIVPITIGLTAPILLVVFTMIPYPTNWTVALLILLCCTLFFVRVQVERSLNSEQALLESASFRWDLEKSLESYMQHLKMKNEEKES